MVGDKRIASKLSGCSIGVSSVVDVSELEGVQRSDIRGTRYAGEAILEGIMRFAVVKIRLTKAPD